MEMEDKKILRTSFADITVCQVREAVKEGTSSNVEENGFEKTFL